MSHIEVVAAAASPYTPSPLTGVTIPSDGTFSAAVYNGQGSLIRTLIRARTVRPGTLNIYWDGLDDDGTQAAPGGEYEVVRYLAKSDLRAHGGR